MPAFSIIDAIFALVGFCMSARQRTQSVPELSADIFTCSSRFSIWAQVPWALTLYMAHRNCSCPIVRPPLLSATRAASFGKIERQEMTLVGVVGGLTS